MRIENYLGRGIELEVYRDHTLVPNTWDPKHVFFSAVQTSDGFVIAEDFRNGSENILEIMRGLKGMVKRFLAFIDSGGSLKNW